MKTTVLVTEKELKDIAEKVAARTVKNMMISEKANLSAFRTLALKAQEHAIAFEKKIIQLLGLKDLNDFPEQEQEMFIKVTRELQEQFCAAVVKAAQELEKLSKAEAPGQQQKTKGVPQAGNVTQVIPINPMKTVTPQLPSQASGVVAEDIANDAKLPGTRVQQPEETGGSNTGFQKKNSNSDTTIPGNTAQFDTKQKVFAELVRLQKEKGVDEAYDWVLTQNKVFPLKGEGSGRAVFDWDENTVAKIAKNEEGQLQNKEEATPCPAIAALYPKVMGSDTNGNWMLIQKVRPLNDSTAEEFEDKFGMSMKGMKQALLYTITNGQQGDERAATAAKQKSPMFNNFVKALKECDLQLSDFTKPDSWGISKDNKILLIDPGLTNALAKEHYTKTPMGLNVNSDIIKMINNGHLSKTQLFDYYSDRPAAKNIVQAAVKKGLITQQQGEELMMKPDARPQVVDIPTQADRRATPRKPAANQTNVSRGMQPTNVPPRNSVTPIQR